MQLVLLLGNFLNGNTYRGGAFGIKIASINKVIDSERLHVAMFRT